MTPSHHGDRTDAGGSRGALGAIVLAGGSGARFGAMKQFVELTPGSRLLDASIAATSGVAGSVIVVMHPDSPTEERDLTTARWPNVTLATGGSSRLESVANGLEALDRAGDHEFVLVHDAAHPLASSQVVERLRAAIEGDPGIDGAVPVLEAVDVVKRVAADGSIDTVGRQGLGSAQVPMVFRRAALRRAHENLTTDALEDSAAIEATGGRVVAVTGEVTNVHVVDDASLALARLIAGNPTQPPS